MKGIGGSLASVELLESAAPAVPPRDSVGTVIAAARRHLGPASGARQIADHLIVPLFTELGFRVSIITDSAALVTGTVLADGAHTAICAVGAWGIDLYRLRSSVTRASVPSNARWWVCCNGIVLRILDAARAYSRRSIDVDLDAVGGDDRGLWLVRHLFSNASAGRLPLLEAVVDRSDRYRVQVGRSLQIGVESALTRLVGAFSARRSRAQLHLDASLDDALTIVYRILFLLFAEARGLVPAWHPVYRASYTIESLRPAVEGRRSAGGLWESLQAITRLAHRGCRAGTLRVVPFNGRLFAPSAAPAAETAVLDDRVARDVLLAITTRAGADRRERISYADLGVEQLGAVYERVLDYRPETAAEGVQLVATGKRKSTGTFYTPRAITEFMVRRTLAPLVRNRSADQILALRIVDPAMGSGAFLVAACRYLADAYEAALVREGSASGSGVGAAERARFRRAIAQRCLYGVDLNPTAVQLARLSLWLCTLAAERPLTFLDHRLRTGNSLLGASHDDLRRQSPGAAGRRAPLTLFDEDDLGDAIAAAVGPRAALASEADDTAEIVRRKERIVAALSGAEGPLARSRAAADVWCAAWFWPPDEQRPPSTAWPALGAAMTDGVSGLPPSLERRWTTMVTDIAARERFFHWELEFPEVFFDAAGRRLPAAGFDAVIGNPPWETLRGDAGSAETRAAARGSAHRVTRFSRESGCFRLQSGGHANLYHLFVERMLQLVRPGGRIGALAPAGLLTDHGSAGLRRELFSRTRIDALVTFDNRDALFPIHRGMRFAALTAARVPGVDELPLLSGVRSAAVLDDVSDEGAVPSSVRLPLSLIERFSPVDLSVPDLRTDVDRRLLALLLEAGPALSDPHGWNARVGRELNATDDRAHFSAGGLPVIEGKALEPFGVHLASPAAFIERATLTRIFGGRVDADRPRLGYREVAAATNARTLIAAIIPANVVTTHTIFCLKHPRDADVHAFLCGIFNSFVANYLVRLRGGTHVPASVIHELPVPFLERDDGRFRAIVSLARRAHDRGRESRAELQARVAHLYGVSPEDFEHITGTLPLVPLREREAARDALRALGYGDRV
ncbi:MAG: Eco57I restriction-modification methylase domain-containing protein [Vicinamibacterales bacterium]